MVRGDILLWFWFIFPWWLLKLKLYGYNQNLRQQKQKYTWGYIKKKKKTHAHTHTQLCCVCATKDSINRVNGKTTKEEKIFPNYIYDKKLIFKIYKMERLKKKFPNNLIFKKELRTWIDIPPKRVYKDDQHIYIFKNE